MSNFLAIATVTATLSQLIQAAIQVDVPGSRVTTVRPDVAGSGPTEAKVNVFLYQVTPNAALRNLDLPTRRADGSIMQRPKAALDLHYLLNFYGDELDLVPQRLLGSVVRTLHGEAMLTRDRITSTITSGAFTFLASSDLADDIELVKFTPLPLSLEELSKLWSVLLQTNYSLSITYQGTVILIESEETPQQALPVQTSKVFIQPFRQPTIDRMLTQKEVDNPFPPNQPITIDDTLVLRGRLLQGDAMTTTQVRIGDNQVTPARKDMTADSINVSLQPLILLAGVQRVQVVQLVKMGDPLTDHNGIESNAFPFVLRPTIVKINPLANSQTDANGLVSGDVTIQVKPDLGSKQRIVLLLNETPGSPTPAMYTFLASSQAANSCTFSLNAVNKATYFVRLQIDGAESVLDRVNHQLVIA